MEATSLLRLIRYHWAIIAVCLALGLLAGQLFASAATPQYTASADVNVTVTGGTSTGEVAQSGNFSQQQARNFGAIATRQVVLDPVIDELDLDVSVADLRDQVSTSVPLNTSIITISATDTSPTRAADIANAVATTLAEVVPALTPHVDGESPVRLQVIETATAPTTPSSPNRPLLLILGFLGGLIVATAIVLVRGVLDARVRTSDDAAEISGAAIVGSISGDRRFDRQPIAIAGDAGARRAEQFRQLRANLRFLQASGSHRVFAFTSSIPGEGKSSTAANIAASLAVSGVRVCLVEADLRRPALADLLDLPAGVGVTSVTLGDVTLDDALLEWGDAGLRVLLSGPIPPNPSEILESEGMHDLMTELQQRFDVIIVDCPPLNPVSDAAVLARTLGGVLLVVGAGKVRVREMRSAVAKLDAVGARIEGVVINLDKTAGSAPYRYEPYAATDRGTSPVTAEETPTPATPDEAPTTEPAEPVVDEAPTTREQPADETARDDALSGTSSKSAPRGANGKSGRSGRK